MLISWRSCVIVEQETAEEEKKIPISFRKNGEIEGENVKVLMSLHAFTCRFVFSWFMFYVLRDVFMLSFIFCSTGSWWLASSNQMKRKSWFTYENWFGSLSVGCEWRVRVGKNKCKLDASRMFIYGIIENCTRNFMKCRRLIFMFTRMSWRSVLMYIWRIEIEFLIASVIVTQRTHPILLYTRIL